jgi:DNA-binding beta-propeller fold protein YncE
MGLWLDQDENVYVAVYSGRVVKKVDREGKVTVAARSGVPWSPTGGLVAPNGDLWLLENSMTNAVRVRQIRRDGTEKIY